MSVSASRHTQEGLPGFLIRVREHEHFVPQAEAARLGAFLVGDTVRPPAFAGPGETVKRLGIWEESGSWA